MTLGQLIAAGAGLIALLSIFVPMGIPALAIAVILLAVTKFVA